MTLDILYRDEYLVVINKPSGMLVHPGREPEPREQIAMKVLRDQIGQRVTTLHRLDRPTSGVLVFALEKAAGSHMRRLFDAHQVEKTYHAVVAGTTEARWENSTPLQKVEGEPFRDSTTEFSRLSVGEIKGKTHSTLRVFPKTGRYHQIRRHLAGDGFPIIGDYLYGDHDEMSEWVRLTEQTRLMLHAASIRFEHPRNGALLDIEAPLPARFSVFEASPNS